MAVCMSELFDDNSNPSKYALCGYSRNSFDIFTTLRICILSGIRPSMISLNSLKEILLRLMFAGCVLHTISKSLSVTSPKALNNSSLNCFKTL